MLKNAAARNQTIVAPDAPEHAANTASPPGTAQTTNTFQLAGQTFGVSDEVAAAISFIARTRRLDIGNALALAVKSAAFALQQQVAKAQKEDHALDRVGTAEDTESGLDDDPREASKATHPLRAWATSETAARKQGLGNSAPSGDDRRGMAHSLRRAAGRAR